MSQRESWAAVQAQATTLPIPGMKGGARERSSKWVKVPLLRKRWRRSASSLPRRRLRRRDTPPSSIAAIGEKSRARCPFQRTSLRMWVIRSSSTPTTAGRPSSFGTRPDSEAMTNSTDSARFRPDAKVNWDSTPSRGTRPGSWWPTIRRWPSPGPGCTSREPGESGRALDPDRPTSRAIRPGRVPCRRASPRGRSESHDRIRRHARTSRP